MTIGASLRSNMQNKEFVRKKIQEIRFQAQLGNHMALFTPNHMTQTLPIAYPTTAHKETPLFRIFHLHKQIS